MHGGGSNVAPFSGVKMSKLLAIFVLYALICVVSVTTTAYTFDLQVKDVGAAILGYIALTIITSAMSAFKDD